MTQAVIDALEEALTRDTKPLAERLQEIARLADPRRSRVVDEQEVDDLWGNP